MNTKDDKLPLSEGYIENELCKESGHTASYLFKVAQEHKLTYGKIKELAYLEQKYHTEFPQMLKLVDEGYTPSQIAEFMQARDELSCDVDTVSLESIVTFAKHFSEIDQTAESIGECVTNIYDRLVQIDPDEYASSGLTSVILYAIHISQGLPEKTYRELESFLDSEIKVSELDTMAMTMNDPDE